VDQITETPRESAEHGSGAEHHHHHHSEHHHHHHHHHHHRSGHRHHHSRGGLTSLQRKVLLIIIAVGAVAVIYLGYKIWGILDPCEMEQYDDTGVIEQIGTTD